MFVVNITIPISFERDSMADVLVIVPTHSNTSTLENALKSIQNQTYDDFKVEIIADGASSEIIGIAEKFVLEDRRFNLQIHDKSSRKGEEHRHRTILKSDANYVTYLCDDDLFLPDHIQYIKSQIAGNDFANPRPTFINREDVVWCIPTDISQPESRKWHLGKNLRNSISLSGVMHTKESNLKLPEGWTVTPDDFPWTDLYMWRKFLTVSDYNFVTTPRCTVLQFLDSPNASDEEKKLQNMKWFKKSTDSNWVAVWDRKVERVHQSTSSEYFVQSFTQEELIQNLQTQLNVTISERNKLGASIQAILDSKTWKYSECYRRFKNLLFDV